MERSSNGVWVLLAKGGDPTSGLILVLWREAMYKSMFFL